jgi:hypothetical protein
MRYGLDCSSVIDQMGAYLAGDLRDRGRERFCVHIRKCAECHDKLLALELVLCLGSDDSICAPALAAGKAELTLRGAVS